jgi:hypothetical protein
MPLAACASTDLNYIAGTGEYRTENRDTARMSGFH